MAHSLGQWIDVLGAVPILALGVYVLTVKPRRRPAVWLAVFATGFGLWTAWNRSDLFFPEIDQEAWYIVALSLSLLWGLGIWGLAAEFPRPLARGDGRSLAASVGVTAAVAVAMLHNLPAWGLSWLGQVWGVLSVLGGTSLFGYGFLLVLRYRTAGSDEDRLSFLVAAAAITLYVGFVAGFGYSPTGTFGVLKATGVTAWWGWATFLPGVALGLLWVSTMIRRNDRAARAMAWLTFGMIVVGLWFSAGTPYRGGFGVTRMAVTGMLVYAIVKHQVLGIDVKLRWTISKSTVAAAFIAVFFVASEAAQQFFGEQFESGYLGILAAGALVFAIAPMSRLADRIAEKAVPVSAPIAVTSTSSGPLDRERAYRTAVRGYLRDGVLTREEERELAHLAGELGIHAGRAMEIRHEIEDGGPRV